jgi:hypothetical protein
MTLHLGFTGTRHGMTPTQFHAVRRVLAEVTADRVFVAHHGDCVGADAEFHDICGTFCGRAIVEIHPGPLSDLSAGCRGTTRHKPMSHMKRDAAIVAASSVMIAAPFEDEPQDRGGTWATIGMARRALRRGELSELHVVGRDGRLLDHGAWQ